MMEGVGVSPGSTVMLDPLCLLSDAATPRLAADVARMPDSEPILQGFLRKEGATPGSWKRRWFVLHKDRLDYYKRQDGGAQQGSIPLSSIVGITADTSAYPQAHAFQLITPTRMYALQAPLETAKRHWLSAVAATLYMQLMQLHTRPDTLPDSSIAEEGEEEGEEEQQLQHHGSHVPGMGVGPGAPVASADAEGGLSLNDIAELDHEITRGGHSVDDAHRMAALWASTYRGDEHASSSAVPGRGAAAAARRMSEDELHISGYGPAAEAEALHAGNSAAAPLDRTLAALEELTAALHAKRQAGGSGAVTGTLPTSQLRQPAAVKGTAARRAAGGGAPVPAAAPKPPHASGRPAAATTTTASGAIAGTKKSGGVQPSTASTTTRKPPIPHFAAHAAGSSGPLEPQLYSLRDTNELLGADLPEGVKLHVAVTETYGASMKHAPAGATTKLSAPAGSSAPAKSGARTSGTASASSSSARAPAAAAAPASASSAVPTAPASGRTYSRLRLDYAKRWVNVTLGTDVMPLEAGAKVGAALRDGVVLCSLLETAERGVHIEGVNPKPRARAACIGNLERALQVMWRLRVRHSKIPSADELCDAREDRVAALLPELMDALALRKVRTSAVATLQWAHAIASMYGDVPHCLEAGAPGYTPAASTAHWQGLFAYLASGVLPALLAHYYGDGQGGAQLSASLPHATGLDNTAPGSSLDLACVTRSPHTVSQRVANWQAALPWLTAAGCRLLFPFQLTAAYVDTAVVSDEDDDFALLQLELLCETLLPLNCALPSLGSFEHVWEAHIQARSGLVPDMRVGVAAVPTQDGAMRQLVVGHRFLDADGWSEEVQEPPQLMHVTPAAPLDFSTPAVASMPWPTRGARSESQVLTPGSVSPSDEAHGAGWSAKAERTTEEATHGWHAHLPERGTWASTSGELQGYSRITPLPPGTQTGADDGEAVPYELPLDSSQPIQPPARRASVADRSIVFPHNTPPSARPPGESDDVCGTDAAALQPALPRTAVPPAIPPEEPAQPTAPPAAPTRPPAAGTARAELPAAGEATVAVITAKRNELYAVALSRAKGQRAHSAAVAAVALKWANGKTEAWAAGAGYADDHVRVALQAPAAVAAPPSPPATVDEMQARADVVEAATATATAQPALPERAPTPPPPRIAAPTVLWSPEPAPGRDGLTHVAPVPLAPASTYSAASQQPAESAAGRPASPVEPRALSVASGSTAVEASAPAAAVALPVVNATQPPAASQPAHILVLPQERPISLLSSASGGRGVNRSFENLATAGRELAAVEQFAMAREERRSLQLARQRQASIASAALQAVQAAGVAIASPPGLPPGMMQPVDSSMANASTAPTSASTTSASPPTQQRVAVGLTPYAVGVSYAPPMKLQPTQPAQESLPWLAGAAPASPPALTTTTVDATPSTSPSGSAGLRTPRMNSAAAAAPPDADQWDALLRIRGGTRPVRCTLTLPHGAMSSTDVADASILKWTSTDRAPGALRIDGSVTLSDIAVADLREDAVTFPGTAVPLLVLRISPARPAAMRSSGGLLVLELLPAAATSEARATHAAFAKSVMSVCSSVRGGASASYGLPTAMGAGSASTTPVQSPVADRVNGWADARGGASSMQVPSAMRSLSSLRATPIGGSLSALLAARGR